jgi:hypothetical protein
MQELSTLNEECVVTSINFERVSIKVASKTVLLSRIYTIHHLKPHSKLKIVK